jgi:hypothetical protein
MGVVHEAVKYCVCVSWVGDYFVPRVDGKLACDDGRSAAVTFFEDFKKILASCRIERLEPPIVQDQDVNAPEVA